MDRAPPVDQVEHRKDWWPTLMNRMEMINDLSQRALRQRRGNDRNDDQIRRANDLLARRRETGRAIEQNAIVAGPERLDQPRKALLLVERREEIIQLS